MDIINIDCMDCPYFDLDTCFVSGGCVIDDSLYWDEEYNEDDTLYCMEYQEWVRPQKKIL